MTREEAIRHLHTYSTTMGSGQTSDEQHKEAKRMAIEALSAEDVQGWIPCSERLPEIYEIVLVCFENGYIAFARMEKDEDEDGRTASNEWYWLAEACSYYWEKCDHITAWMPLPEPYKGAME